MRVLGTFGKANLLVELLYAEYREQFNIGKTALDFTNWFQVVSANNGIAPYTQG